MSYGAIGPSYRHRVYVPEYLGFGRWDTIDLINRQTYYVTAGVNHQIAATAIFEHTVGINQTITHGLSLTQWEFDVLKQQIENERTV